METCGRAAVQQDTKSGDAAGEDTGRTAILTTGDADEGYETAGKKDLLPTGRGLAKEQRKVGVCVLL